MHRHFSRREKWNVLWVTHSMSHFTMKHYQCTLIKQVEYTFQHITRGLWTRVSQTSPIVEGPTASLWRVILYFRLRNTKTYGEQINFKFSGMEIILGTTPIPAKFSDAPKNYVRTLIFLRQDRFVSKAIVSWVLANEMALQ